MHMEGMQRTVLGGFGLVGNVEGVKYQSSALGRGAQCTRLLLITGNCSQKRQFTEKPPKKYNLIPPAQLHSTIAMDIDIDNLLQTYDSTESSSNDLQRLQTLWTAELAAPELLPYPGELVERLMQRLRQQLDVIEGLGAEYTDAREGFKNVILQTEVERVKYLLRVYLRTRLSKVRVWPSSFPISIPFQQLLCSH